MKFPPFYSFSHQRAFDPFDLELAIPLYLLWCEKNNHPSALDGTRRVSQLADNASLCAEVVTRAELEGFEPRPESTPPSINCLLSVTTQGGGIPPYIAALSTPRQKD